MSGNSPTGSITSVQFVIEICSLEKENLLDNESRLTDALTTRLPSTKKTSGSILELVQAAVPDSPFDSLYQLLQYLKCYLLASFGGRKNVEFIQNKHADATTVTIRRGDESVDIGYKLEEESNKTDPAERALTITKIVEGKGKALADNKEREEGKEKEDDTSAPAVEKREEEKGEQEENDKTNAKESSSMEDRRNEWDEKWQSMLDKLKEFKTEKGHANVPKDYIPDRSLGSWVASQRTVYKEGKLRQDRIDSLNELEFVWSFRTIGKAEDLKEQADEVDGNAPAMERKWQAMLERLKEYKKEHGDTRVPSGYKPDPPLAYWVQNQRVLYKKEKLAKERIDALEELGFLWKIYAQDGSSPTGAVSRRSSKAEPDEKWNELLDRLKAFKEEFGHCSKYSCTL